MSDVDKGPTHHRRGRPPQPEAEAQPQVPVLGGARRHAPRRVQQPPHGTAEVCTVQGRGNLRKSFR